MQSKHSKQTKEKAVGGTKGQTVPLPVAEHRSSHVSGSSKQLKEPAESGVTGNTNKKCGCTTAALLESNAV
jgi:hypothetical protein